MQCCTCRQCSSVICYTADGMLHIQPMFVCYMLHSWWNVAHTGNVRLLYSTQLMECCTYRKYTPVIRYTVDAMLHHAGNIPSVICCTVNGMLHIQEMFVCYMLHSWWNVAHTGNVLSVICYTVDGMLHLQEMFACYMLHIWWSAAHAGKVRLLYATQLMECCTYRRCSSVICYTADGMFHIQAMFFCYISTQLMECCTYRKYTPVLCYTVDAMLHMQAIFVCYMLHSWWNVAHTGNVRLLYAT